MNDANPDEYYVLENRQLQGWDDYLGRICIGLQVNHVDFLAGPWNQNKVNTDPYHQRMTIIASNNCCKGANSATSSAEYLACLQGNFFPGSTAADALTDETLCLSVFLPMQCKHCHLKPFPLMWPVPQVEASDDIQLKLSVAFLVVEYTYLRGRMAYQVNSL